MSDLCGMWGPPNGWLCREPKGHEGQHVWRPDPNETPQYQANIRNPVSIITDYDPVTGVAPLRGGLEYNRPQDYHPGQARPTIICTASGMTTQILDWRGDAPAQEAGSVRFVPSLGQRVRDAVNVLRGRAFASGR